MKIRKPFTLLSDTSDPIGHGVYYPVGGNVQVYLASSGTYAWQFASLGEVLLLDGVMGFQWDVQEASD